jgi:hypothetical protein
MPPKNSQSGKPRGYFTSEADEAKSSQWAAGECPQIATARFGLRRSRFSTRPWEKTSATGFVNPINGAAELR